MGNSSSTPVAELVYQAAKYGNFPELQDLAKLGNELRPSDDGYVPRSQLLEWQDADGRTALLVATKKKHAACVELLLQSGANVQHQSTQKVGCGSALHFAAFYGCSREIINLLIRFGASPFVENCMGLTALDYALTQRCVPIIRQFESLGLFTNYLLVRTSAFMGFKTSWTPRWVAVTPRCPYPNLPPNQRIIRRVLQIFPDSGSALASSSVYLDGARAETSHPGRNGKPTTTLVLHPNHILPKGDLTIDGDSVRGFRLSFQPANIVNANQILEHFATVVNHHLTPGGTSQGQNPSEQRPSVSHNPAVHTNVQPSVPSNIPPAVSVHYPVATNSPTQAGNAGHHNLEPAPYAGGHDDSAPSAPPLPVNDYFPPSDRGTPPEPEDDKLCVICLSEPRTAGFLHGSSVHICCCVECARNVMENGNKQCPLCRQEIQSIIEHFYH